MKSNIIPILLTAIMAFSCGPKGQKSPGTSKPGEAEPSVSQTDNPSAQNNVESLTITPDAGTAQSDQTSTSDQTSPSGQDSTTQSSGPASSHPSDTSSATDTEDTPQDFVFGGLKFDKLVHYFGDILVTDGPQSCTFTFTNVGEVPAAVYEVVSSCGCTDVTWTKEPLRPGAKGKITATYDNKAGALPFDKTLTVYISDLKRPVVLHLRGVVHEKKLPLKELYPVHGGPLGLKDTQLKAGNLQQGETVGNETTLANLSSSPVNVSFGNVSEGLSLSVSPNPVPAGGIAALRFSVTASEKRWGQNYYNADVLAGGKPTGLTLNIFAYTKANFDNLSEEEKSQAALPVFESTSVDVGKVRKGTVTEGSFTFKNSGKRPFEVMKIDSDTKGVTTVPLSPVAPGAKGAVKATFDTSEAPVGELLVIISLTTNSPLRPIVNLFLTGEIIE